MSEGRIFVAGRGPAITDLSHGGRGCAHGVPFVGSAERSGGLEVAVCQYQGLGEKFGVCNANAASGCWIG